MRVSTNQRRAPSRNGFTLIELIAVIVLAGLVFSFSSTVLSQIFGGFALKHEATEADWQAKVALERMARELRAVRSATATDLAFAANQIRLIDTEGNSVCFYLNGTALTRAQDGPAAASCGPSGPQVLADNISALGFTYWKDDGTAAAAVDEIYHVTVALTVTQGSYSASFRTNVRPRNF